MVRVGILRFRFWIWAVLEVLQWVWVLLCGFCFRSMTQLQWSRPRSLRKTDWNCHRPERFLFRELR